MIGFYIVASLAILCSFGMGFYCGAEMVCSRLGINLDQLERRTGKKCSSGKCYVSSEIITAHKKHLVARCEERGYDLSEVMPCVVFRDGDMWTVNTSHPKYPGKPKK